MPFWILLYEDSDLDAIHQAFKSVVQPYFGVIAPVQCTVAYTILTETREIFFDFLNDNANISAAPEARHLGLWSEATPRPDDGIFGSAISGKRPVS